MGCGRDGGNATYCYILPDSRQTTNPTLPWVRPCLREQNAGDFTAALPPSDRIGPLCAPLLTYLLPATLYRGTCYMAGSVPDSPSYHD